MYTSPSEGMVTATVDPAEDTLRAIACSIPTNPFLTPGYARARIGLGATAVTLSSRVAGVEQGFTAFLATGRVHKRLDIPSAPAVDGEDPIWRAVVQYCMTTGVTRLNVQSFATTGGRIPTVGHEIRRRARREFVLDLGPDCPPLSMASNHRRNIARARKAGIRVIESADRAAADLHAALIGHSMQRRRQRGEDVSTQVLGASFLPFLETGAGTLFQALTPDDDVVSSILVLLARQGAYYHSAGTSPAGMAQGASQLLIAGVAERLRERGIVLFNLGGADPAESGLARFKAGFGARPVELEAATFDLTRGYRRIWTRALDSLRLGLARWRDGSSRSPE